MTIKGLLPLIVATLLCSGTVLVEANQPKSSVSPTKTKVSQSKTSVSPTKPKVSQSKTSLLPAKPKVSPTKTKVSQSKTSVSPTKPKVSQSKTSVSPTKPKVSQPVQPKWKLFTAPDGRFTILMPGVPVQNTQAQKTYMGVINLELFVAQPPKQEVAYIVAYNDFPYSYGQIANPQDVLNHARDLALKTTKSNLISQRNIRSSNGHPGKEIEYVNSGGKITKTRMYFAQGRLYQVMAVSSKKQHKSLAKTITGYLNSFQVVLKT